MNTEQKIAKLTLILNQYLKYTVWTNVGVTLIEDKVIVTWFSPTFMKNVIGAYIHYTTKVFPVGDIDTRIEKWQAKLRYERRKRLLEHANRVAPETTPENTPKK